MKAIWLFFLTVLSVNMYGEGYQIGDQASDFRLKNVDGKYVTLADYPNARGFVVIFTCNNCPYARAYQDRIIALDKEFKSKGFPVIAINPNDPDVEPGDSYDAMVTRAREKGYPFPYLFDEKHEVYKVYGATNTPHAYVLQKNNKGQLIVKYIGAVDDNFQDASAVKKSYIRDAINALLSGKEPEPSFTKAVGCGVKSKHV